MRILAISLLCFLSFTASAQARHHRTIQHTNTVCTPTNDIMRPCAYNPNFLSGVRSVDVRMKRVETLKHVATRLERHGRRLIATAPSYSQDEERQSFSPVRAVHTGAQVIGGRPSGCPYQYCGCSASLRVFGKIIPDLNLAANWGKFPSASPAPGMVAYRRHHVFVIESVNSDGTVVAHDGNSGHHLTRIHTVSLRGYRVVNPHG